LPSYNLVVGKIVWWFAQRPLAHGALVFVVALGTGLVRSSIGSVHTKSVLPFAVGAGALAIAFGFLLKRLDAVSPTA